MNNRLPKEIYEEVHVGKRKSIEKMVNIIFDKGQALVRLPTTINPLMDLKKGDKMKIEWSEEEPKKIICEVVR